MANDKKNETTAVVKPTKPAKKKSDKPSIFKRIGASFKAMGSELKKVTWPSWKTTSKATGVVLAVVFTFLIVVYGFDFLFGTLLQLLIK